MRCRRIFLLSAVLLCFVAGTPAQDFSRVDWGPLFSRYEDAFDARRTRVLGPLYEHSFTPEGVEITAFRPLVSGLKDPAHEKNWQEYLWPIMSARQFRNESSKRILTAWYNNFDTSRKDSRYRFWFLPFYFQGRDAEGRGYFALFPFGGRIRDLLLLDEANFVLFPLYLSTWQARGDIQSKHIVWPFIGRTTGKGIYRFRVLPFYAQNKHRDQFVKRSVLWPFWSSAEYFEPGSQGTAWLLFPIAGSVSRQDQDGWMFLPPFFKVSHSQRQDDYKLPWPLVQVSRGEVRKTSFFPFWGSDSIIGYNRSYMLWPLFRTERADRVDFVRKRFFLVPFVQSVVDRDVKPDALGKHHVRHRYFMLWPLLSWWREGEWSRFRTLELWPFRNTGPVERSYAPFWHLFQRTSDGFRTETEMFWGMVRHASGPARTYWSVFPLAQYESRGAGYERRWSVGKGLIGYEREGRQRMFRLLYLFKLKWTGGASD